MRSQARGVSVGSGVKIRKAERGQILSKPNKNKSIISLLMQIVRSPFLAVTFSFLSAHNTVQSSWNRQSTQSSVIPRMITHCRSSRSVFQQEVLSNKSHHTESTFTATDDIRVQLQDRM